MDGYANLIKSGKDQATRDPTGTDIDGKTKAIHACGLFHPFELWVKHEQPRNTTLRVPKMNILPPVLEVIGLVAVGLCFFALMPAVGTVLAVLSQLFVGEQAYSKAKGKDSGTIFIDPNEYMEDQG